MKKPTKKRLDSGDLVLVVGIVVMSFFLIYLCFIAAVIGTLAVLLYALPYVVVAGYSALILKRKEVTSVILKRMTIFANILGVVTSLYLMITFGMSVRIL